MILRASLVTQLVKNPPAMRETCVGKIPWRRERLPTLVFWPGEFHELFHGVAKSCTQLSDFHMKHFSGFQLYILKPVLELLTQMQVASLPAEPQQKPKNTGGGSLSLRQGIFPTQEPNWGLPHCRRILYQLSHKGSPTELFHY